MASDLKRLGPFTGKQWALGAAGGAVMFVGYRWWRGRSAASGVAAQTALAGGTTIPGDTTTGAAAGTTTSTPTGPLTLAGWEQQALQFGTPAEMLNAITNWMSGNCIDQAGFNGLSSALSTIGLPPGMTSFMPLIVCAAPTTTGSSTPSSGGPTSSTGSGSSPNSPPAVLQTTPPPTAAQAPAQGDVETTPGWSPQQLNTYLAAGQTESVASGQANTNPKQPAGAYQAAGPQGPTVETNAGPQQLAYPNPTTYTDPATGQTRLVGTTGSPRDPTGWIDAKGVFHPN